MLHSYLQHNDPSAFAAAVLDTSSDESESDEYIPGRPSAHFTKEKEDKKDLAHLIIAPHTRYGDSIGAIQLCMGVSVAGSDVRCSL